MENTVIRIGIWTVILTVIGAFGTTEIARCQKSGLQERQIRTNASAATLDMGGGTISYQGVLMEDDLPANGVFDMAFQFFKDAGCTVNSGYEVPVSNVNVMDGVFNTEITTGYSIFIGEPRWMRTSVEGEVLSCTPVNAVPYAISLLPGATIIGSVPAFDGLHIVNSADEGSAYGIYARTDSPGGHGGHFSAPFGGTAIYADGAIESSTWSVVWISGNDARPYQSDVTVGVNTTGGAIVTSSSAGKRNVMLPITVPGVVFGQNMRVTDLEIYWAAGSADDAISAVLLRRQTGVCPTCYATLAEDHSVRYCDPAANPEGCHFSKSAMDNNILDEESGILYLTIEMDFDAAGHTVTIGGARLHIRHH